MEWILVSAVIGLVATKVHSKIIHVLQALYLNIMIRMVAKFGEDSRRPYPHHILDWYLLQNTESDCVPNLLRHVDSTTSVDVFFCGLHCVHPVIDSYVRMRRIIVLISVNL